MVTYVLNKTCAYVCLYIYMYLPNPLYCGQDVTQGQFLSGEKLVWHSREENCWIQAFLKGISAKWTANNLVQDFKSSYGLYFLWQ